MQDRTEQASPRKRQEARDRGQVPRSPELNTALLLLGSALAFSLAGPPLARGMVQLYTHVTLQAAFAPATAYESAAWLRTLGWSALGATLPLLLAIAAVAFAAAAAQARGVLSLTPIQPDWQRISPLANARRIFGKQSIVELLKSLFKLAVIGLALWRGVAKAWGQVTSVGQQEPMALLRVMLGAGTGMLLTAGLAYLVIAGADYAWQLWQHEQKLRMTKEEVKQENKDTEGDPLIKSRLRSLARARLRRQMFDQVPTADVVVTNPTRIAVALRYDPQLSGAPIVLAMGQRKIAQRIRELALKAGVPVIENKPLARALLATARVGEPIPAALYVAVAEVLAFVIRRRQAGADAWAGSVTV